MEFWLLVIENYLRMVWQHFTLYYVLSKMLFCVSKELLQLFRCTLVRTGFFKASEKCFYSIFKDHQLNLFKNMFHAQEEWPNPVILKNGDGIFPLRAAQRRVKEIKIPCESWKVQSYFPMRGLAGILKKNFPMSGEAANGEIFFSVWLLSLEWGNMIVPWMTNREFFPSPFF